MNKEKEVKRGEKSINGKRQREKKRKTKERKTGETKNEINYQWQA